MPKNEFGNIEFYVPSMLPAGSAHIPCEYHRQHCSFFHCIDYCFRSVKGVAKIAKKLGFDYAEAVVCHLLLPQTRLSLLTEPLSKFKTFLPTDEL